MGRQGAVGDAAGAQGSEETAMVSHIPGVDVSWMASLPGCEDIEAMADEMDDAFAGGGDPIPCTCGVVGASCFWHTPLDAAWRWKQR